MKGALPYCVFALTVFVAGALALFHANALATQTSQPQRKSFKAGGLRTFEIVPLETVSETSANASIGDLNGDGHPDCVDQGPSLGGAKPNFFRRRQRKLHSEAASSENNWQQMVEAHSRPLFPREVWNSEWHVHGQSFIPLVRTYS